MRNLLGGSILKCFSTFYAVGGAEYMSYVFAASRSEADQLVKARNIGERVAGLMAGARPTLMAKDLPSVLYRSRLLPDCAHSIAFLSWIVARSGQMNNQQVADWILGDQGILHDVLHEIHHPKQFGFREVVMARIEELEERVPGLAKKNSKSENMASSHGFTAKARGVAVH